MDSKRVVLVEGPCGAGKSTLIASLAELARRKGVATRVFAQRQTYGPIAPSEDLGILDDGLNFAILTRIVDTIEQAVHELQSPSLLLIDTLHLTQLVRPGVLSLASYQSLDRRMGKLLSLVVFLRAQRQTLLDRAVEGRRGSEFLRYARRFASSDDRLLAYFVNTQERLLEALLSFSKSPSLVLDAEVPTNELARAVFSALAATQRA